MSSWDILGFLELTSMILGWTYGLQEHAIGSQELSI
jgi:hypothetical protein